MKSNTDAMHMLNVTIADMIKKAQGAPSGPSRTMLLPQRGFSCPAILECPATAASSVAMAMRRPHSCSAAGLQGES